MNEPKPISEFIDWLSAQENPSEALQTALQALQEVSEAAQRTEAAPQASDLALRLNYPVFAWLQKAALRSSLVSRMTREAEDQGWTQHEFLFHLTGALYTENETLKERVAQYVGHYGLPSDPVVVPRS
jgi:hypothetical protein